MHYACLATAKYATCNPPPAVSHTHSSKGPSCEPAKSRTLFFCGVVLVTTANTIRAAATLQFADGRFIESRSWGNYVSNLLTRGLSSLTYFVCSSARVVVDCGVLQSTPFGCRHVSSVTSSRSPNLNTTPMTKSCCTKHMTPPVSTRHAIQVVCFLCGDESTVGTRDTGRVASTCDAVDCFADHDADCDISTAW